jgi:Kae1-associated kinase Bud32
MIIGRGAEAVLKKEGESLLKERISKGYRIKEIDLKLRKDRTKKEANLLSEARRHGVRVPRIVSKDMDNMTIEMEYIDGPVLRDTLDKLTKSQRKNLCQEIGKMVANLHLANIVHGDLTTSNMILKDGKIDTLYFIDFGLGYISPKVEDKAVDLHLLKQALVSKHNKVWKECFDAIISVYKKEERDSERVLNRMAQIEKRGRYAKKED